MILPALTTTSEQPFSADDDTFRTHATYRPGQSAFVHGFMMKALIPILSLSASRLKSALRMTGMLSLAMRAVRRA